MLSAADSLMWDALEIGPQWILRETEDVTLERREFLERELQAERKQQQNHPDFTDGGQGGAL